MPSTTAEEKGALRRRARQILEGLSPAEAYQSDEALFRRFLALPQVEGAKTIFAFWGVPGREPDTSRLIAALLKRGKEVCLPRMLPERGLEARRYGPASPLVPAPFGILEPGADRPLVSKGDIGLALVPAVCYDRRGYRLGFGGGYYDRWLADFAGFRVGLCRQAVLQDRVPAEGHDSRVDLLITEGGCLSPL